MIKRAYRRAAKKYHPDVSPRGEERFKEVQEAYETLSDPKEFADKPFPFSISALHKDNWLIGGKISYNFVRIGS